MARKGYPAEFRRRALDLVAAGKPVAEVARLLEVSDQPIYMWRRQELIDRGELPGLSSEEREELRVARRRIRELETVSYGNYGAHRVHAELVLGRGIRVGHNAVAMLMQRARIAGRSGARRRWGLSGAATADDLVDRMFIRERPNQLWVTDITEHPTREGKVYCAVVLDTFSRRVVGWSISHNPTAGLTCNALGMAVEHREAQRGETVIHSDHGTQTGLNRSSQHFAVDLIVNTRSVLLPVSSSRASCGVCC